MCISRISMNLFPFDARPLSKIATSALITAVVTGILLTAACVLKWGVTAYSIFAVTGGVSAMVVCAIIACQKPIDERGDLLGQQTEMLKHKRQEMSQALYVCVQRNDIEGFKGAMSCYDKETIVGLCTVDSGCKTDTGTVLLFAHLLGIQDEFKRIEFLTAALEKFEDYAFDALPYIYDTLLDIQSLDVKSVILKKFNAPSIRRLFDRIFTIVSHSNDKKYSDWLQALMREGLKDSFICRAITDKKDGISRDYLINCLESARVLDAKTKENYRLQISNLYQK